MWTCIHTPGIHTNAKLIYANYAMVYKEKKRKEPDTETKHQAKNVRDFFFKTKLEVYIHTTKSFCFFVFFVLFFFTEKKMGGGGGGEREMGQKQQQQVWTEEREGKNKKGRGERGELHGSRDTRRRSTTALYVNRYP